MMTDYRSILDMGSERAVADLAVKALEEKPGDFPMVLEICFLDQYPLSMRAARVIQLYCEKYPESLYPCLEETVNRMLSAKTDGVRRNFLKIFSEFIDINRIPDPGPLINACFSWLQDPGEKPAIRIHAMNLVAKFGEQIPEILRELKVSLEMIDQDSEISIRNCAVKMLKRLLRNGH